MQVQQRAREQVTGQDGRFLRGRSGNPAGKRLMAERARLEEEERRAEAAALAADLGHPPTAAERLLIDEAAALAVEARKRRRLGRPSADVSRLLVRVLRQLGLGKPAEQPSAPDLSTYLASAAAKLAAEEHLGEEPPDESAA
jgi:hypothetical protein